MPRIEPSTNGDLEACLRKNRAFQEVDIPKRKKPRFSGGIYPKRKNRAFQEGISKSLQDIKTAFCKHYYFGKGEDQVIDVVLGTVAGTHLDSDPLWLHVISAPSGGKTALLDSVFGCKETFFISHLTSASLISGYKDPTITKSQKQEAEDEQDGEKEEEEDEEPSASEEEEEGDEEEVDYSLLPQLDGKTVVTKDFTIIHDLPSETRRQILSLLRDCYDGYASRAVGNSKVKGFHSKFNYLTGMTPDIETSWSLNTLGERFLMYRLNIDDRRAHARQSLRNANKTDEIRDYLRDAVALFIESIPKDFVPGYNGAMEDRILDLADLLASCRTYVHRDRKDEMLFLPLPALASRVAKQLLRVGQSVALVRGKEMVSDDEFAIMKRIALDSLPTNRRRILQSLWSYARKYKPINVFEKETGLSRTTTRRNLDDLRALEVVEKMKLNSKTKPQDGYRLAEPYFSYAKSVGGL